jgi:hypothetical protein
MLAEPPQGPTHSQLSRRALGQSLLGVPTGNPHVDTATAAVAVRARLIRAEPARMHSLLVFSGPNGLVVAPFVPDPLAEVDCIVATPAQAMGTWLDVVRAPIATTQPTPEVCGSAERRSPRRDPNESGPCQVSPKMSLQESFLGHGGMRAVLSLEVHSRGAAPWQALTVTGRTTRWGVADPGQDVSVRHGCLLDLWVLLRRVVQIPTVSSNGQAALALRKTRRAIIRNPEKSSRPYGSCRRHTSGQHLN